MLDSFFKNPRAWQVFGYRLFVLIHAWKRSKFALLFCLCNFNERALDVLRGHLILCSFFLSSSWWIYVSYQCEGFPVFQRAAGSCLRLPSPGSLVQEREEGTCPS